MLTRPLHKLDSHHNIIVEEPPRILPISSYSTDDSGKMYHHLWSGIAIQLFDVFGAHQIVFALPHHENIFTAGVVKPRNNALAEKTTASCNADSLLSKVAHLKQRPI